MRLLSNITFLAALLATAVSCGGDNPNPIEPPRRRRSFSWRALPAIVREATSCARNGRPLRRADPNRRARAVHRSSAILARAVSFRSARRRSAAPPRMPTWRRRHATFHVSVASPQTLAKTKFMAFGDSITEGAVSLAPLVMLAGRRKRIRSSSSRCCSSGTWRSRLSSSMKVSGGEDTPKVPVDCLQY